jgi:hypothetical protein
MRNLENAIKKINTFNGPLSEALVVRTAKPTLNQYNRGWIRPKTTECAEAIDHFGVMEFLEKPLRGRKLDQDLTNKGISWLRSYLFTSKGEPRRTKDVKDLPYSTFQIVKDFAFFTFDEFIDDGYGNYQPVWRVHSKNGQSFAYCFTGGAYSYGGGVECWGYRL